MGFIYKMYIKGVNSKVIFSYVCKSGYQYILRTLANRIKKIIIKSLKNIQFFHSTLIGNDSNELSNFSFLKM